MSGSNASSERRRDSVGSLPFSLAAIIWGVSWTHTLAAVAPAFFVAVLLLRLAPLVRRRLGARAPVQVPAAFRRFGIRAVALVCFVWGATRPELLENDQLTGMGSAFADRRPLEESPSIFPRVVRDDRPQTFYLRAEGTHVEVELGAGRARTTRLGEGLFRADYDPRSDGLPGGDGFVDTKISVDGRVFERRLGLGRGLFRPTACCRADGFLVLLSEDSDEAFRIDRAGSVTSLRVGDGPTACAIATSTIFVTHRWSGEILALDSDGRRLRSSVIGPATSLDLRGDVLLIGVEGRHPEARALSLSLELLSSRSLPEPADVLKWVRPSEGRFAVFERRSGSVRLETFGGEGLEIVGLEIRTRFGRRPARVEASGDRFFVALSDYRPNQDAGPNHFVDDQVVVLDAARLLPLGRIVTKSEGSGALIVGLSTGPSGTFATAAGSDELLELDAASLSVVRRWSLADRMRAPTLVSDLGGGTLLVASTSQGRAFLFTMGEGADSLRAFPLRLPAGADEPLVRAGEAAFHEATKRGVACASCHVGADSDYARHDIGHESPRPTLSARGVIGTSPFLRGGSYPSFASFRQVAEEVLGGFRTDSEQRFSALDAYLASMIPDPSPPIEDLARARAGVEAFVRAGCEGCHRFPAFTRLAAVPEKRLFSLREDSDQALDIPSLLGLAQSAPYLSDARATTIEEVLDEAGSHGEVERLSAAEREDLMAFLRSL
ncbi:MAG: hypothetical protein HY791_35715 [Deltaproteobacteria bacterium]|nr:hypothetical protein [Deltaproteobacteria bacterium]